MKYFFDCEFLEGPQKEKFPISLFRKQTPPTIDLISIGIVAEDGSEYYAISKDFNLEEAWNRFDIKKEKVLADDVFGEDRIITKKVFCIREYVLKPIWRELFFKADLDNDVYSNKQADQYFKDLNSGGYDHYFSFKSLKSFISKYGKTNKQIANEIISFTTKAVFEESENGRFNIGTDSSDKITKGDIVWDEPEFYAYFADYDWVVFCWIFGRMIDLPNGFPKYCIDLQQIKEDKWESIIYDVNKKLKYQGVIKHINDHPDYPKQVNEHNALSDAIWNKKLYYFLKNF